MSLKRLFVAVDLPDELADGLTLMQAGVPGARWTDPDQMHVTLRFVGEVDGLVFRDVMAGLDEVEMQPFEVSLAGFGHFPPRGRPRSLWAGLGLPGLDELRELKRAVDRAVNVRGVEVEHRKYVPHVTIARLDETPTARVARFLASHSLYRSEPFTVDAFHLYSSKLYHSGAIHTLEASYSLGDHEDL